MPRPRDETYTYDDAGNRLTATMSGSTRTFTYGTDGQLDTCTSPTCAVSYDATGRMATITDNGVSWTFAYDGDGTADQRLRGHDLLGRRVSTGSTTSTTARATGPRSARRPRAARSPRPTCATRVTPWSRSRSQAPSPGPTPPMTRAGSCEVCDPDCAIGHDLPRRLERPRRCHGALAPERRRHAHPRQQLHLLDLGHADHHRRLGLCDLGFRFLYVGASDVQWDSSFGLGLLLHARPDLQPGRSGASSSRTRRRADGNLYRYAGNSPVTKADPSGTFGSSVNPNPLEWYRCLVVSPWECSTWAADSAVALLIGRMYRDSWKQNAYRHCTWQCLLTAHLGKQRAETWALLHEIGAPRFNYLDFRVDMHNNYVGRLFGEQIGGLPGSRVGWAFYFCNQAWNRGWLWKADTKAQQIYWSDGRPVS